MTSICEAGLGSAWLMTQDAAGGRRFVREIGLSRRFGNLRGGRVVRAWCGWAAGRNERSPGAGCWSRPGAGLRRRVGVSRRTL